MDVYSRIEALMGREGITAYRLSKETGISTALLSQWKKRLQSPSGKKLEKIADYFQVSVDFLLGKGEPAREEGPPLLTRKDQRDISKKLSETLDLLENAGDGLMFDGEPLDDETRELLRISLQNQLEMTKRLAKQKYAPKKRGELV